MTRTKQTARLSTGGSAKHIALIRLPMHPEADHEADQMQLDMPPLELQVSIQHAIEHLLGTMGVVLYSIAPCVKMGVIFGSAMRKSVAVQFVQTASRFPIMNLARLKPAMSGSDVCPVTGKFAEQRKIFHIS